ncbi:MAG: hypothetical protein NC081_08510 [Roseburia sp.]|nr:hypothetical protein [Roseburia sp.]
MKKEATGFRNLKARLLPGICCLLLCLCVWDITARADEAGLSESAFTMDLKLLSGADSETYDIQVTVSNTGEDFDGVIRLLAAEEYLAPCAYDTVISLPSGSTKQFLVSIPVISENSYTGPAYIQVLDKKKQVKAQKEFKDFFIEEANHLPMGILSDDFTALTFMDMGGDTIYYYGDDYPLKLVELTKDNLTESLDSLVLLVIDQYDTSVLDEETLSAIEDWVYNGGALIIGTGAYGEKTLAGFGEDRLEIQVTHIDGPNEQGARQPDIIVDTRKLSMASLNDFHHIYSENYEVGGYTRSQGYGALGVLPYSLTELGTLDASSYDYMDPEYFVNTLIDFVSSYASNRYGGQNYASYVSYYMQNFFASLSNSNNALHFGILKFMIILYVIFAGPILYLILRAVKKQEFYWAAAPLTAFIMIFLVYLAGRGFEVTSTKVYSVSVADASGQGNMTSYLQCYDAGHREWSVKLDDAYRYAGTLLNDKYDYDSELNWYHHIIKEGASLSVGLKPASSFENVYYMATKDNPESGGIATNNLTNILNSTDSYVTNYTGKDFRYFAVLTDSDIYVYDRLPAGETCDLQNRVPLNSNQGVYHKNYNIIHDFRQYILRPAYEQDSNEDAGALSALGVGISAVYHEGDSLVIGVVENYTKTVDDTCSEISYACVYTNDVN